MGRKNRQLGVNDRASHTLVPERCKEDHQLGLWVHHRRQSCKDEYRIRLLNSIGFHWDARTDSWMEMFQRLIASKTEHDITRVPRKLKKISNSDYGYLPSADVAKRNIVSAF